MIINIEIDENSHREKENFIKYFQRVTTKPIKRTYELDKAFCTNAKLLYDYLFYLFAEIESKDFFGLRLPLVNNPDSCKLSQDLEKVFSKNTVYALNYLFITNQKEFSDTNLNKKIMKRVYDNPDYSFFYSAYILKGRISAEREKVFLKSNKAMYHYAKFVIKDRFESEIENVLKLKTFSHDYMNHKVSRSAWYLNEMDCLKLYFEDLSKDKIYCYNYIRKICRF